jgi:hypothetical protein
MAGIILHIWQLFKESSRNYWMEGGGGVGEGTTVASRIVQSNHPLWFSPLYLSRVDRTLANFKNKFEIYCFEKSININICSVICLLNSGKGPKTNVNNGSDTTQNKAENPETHIKRQRTTRHDCLPRLLGDGDT